MKSLFGTLILVFVFCLSVFSQENKNSSCPVIKVYCPAGIVDFGEPMTFTASPDKRAENYDIEYVWSVSKGEIIEGQGTSAIKVFLKDVGEHTTATVEIKGLPDGCSNTASETYAIAICYLEANQIDEFSISELRIDKARIDNLLGELQNNPNDQGFIVEKFKKGISKTTIKNKLQKLSAYIKLRGYDPARITIVQASADKNLTQLWRVPPGTEIPTF